MKLIAIDTATEACTVALMIDGQINERFEIEPRGHARLLLPMVESLLSYAGLGVTQLDGLVLGRGPGSFTGVRIAASVVQGIAFAADLPVVNISTLAVLAQGAVREHGQHRLLTAIDARRGEVYWGKFHVDTDGNAAAIGDESVCAPDEVSVPDQGEWAGVGSGWGVYQQLLDERLVGLVGNRYPEALPHAQDLARLGEAGFSEGRACAPELALPQYLRNNVADRPGALD